MAALYEQLFDPIPDRCMFVVWHWLDNNRKNIKTSLAFKTECWRSAVDSVFLPLVASYPTQCSPSPCGRLCLRLLRICGATPPSSGICTIRSSSTGQCRFRWLAVRTYSFSKISRATVECSKSCCSITAIAFACGWATSCSSLSAIRTTCLSFCRTKTVWTSRPSTIFYIRGSTMDYSRVEVFWQTSTSIHISRFYAEFRIHKL